MQSVFRLYLLQDHVLDLKILPIVKGENGVDCYKVSAQERGDALVRKQSALEDGTGVRVISQHDLRAIGFKVVEQHQRDSCSPLNDESVCQFYAQLNALADVNHDGQVTADELRQTLRNPEFRDRWSKLVVRHHTEWQTPSDGASVQLFRDRLSHNPELLRHECERIDKLVFWDEVAVKLKLPVDGRVSYFHPVEFMGAFMDEVPKITVDMLKQVFEGLKNTDEKDDLLLEMANQINENSEKYKLDTRLRLSHFFAQVRQEVGAKCRIEEDFTYSPQGLKGTFRYFRENQSEAALYGYGTAAKFVSQESQVAIGNRAYGNKYGNGDMASGDGWRYRGRGLKHLTFKSNYESFGIYHRVFWGEDVDCVTSPDLLHADFK